MPATIYQEITGEVKPLPNDILVHNMEKGDKVYNGIILLDDNGKEHGIHPRWCQIYKLGSKVEGFEIGDWILMAHGRWTYGINLNTTTGDKIYLQKIDPNDILLHTKEKPNI